MTTEYEEGYNSYFSGKKNPYAISSVKWEDYEEGFADAYRDNIPYVNHTD